MIKKRATDIVLLCEDKRHEQFARRFLLRRGVPGRRIRSLIAPPGSGDAKLWVRQCYPDEIRAYRTKSNSIHNILFVMTDVDNESVVKRSESLENACHDVRLDGLRSGERIVLALPKWAIETWILSIVPQKGLRNSAQGSDVVATLGYGTKSHWDSIRTVNPWKV